MSAKYLVDEALIPDDGSKEIIQEFCRRTNDNSLEVLVFPDVHYKKGARVANGMLTSSEQNIFPSMLGVANCGFTFGRVENVTIEHRQHLEETFTRYAKVLKAYNDTRVYSDNFILDMFEEYLTRFYQDERYQRLFQFIEVDSLEKLKLYAREVLTKKHIKLAASTLGTLGGGNHFFELQYVEESYSDKWDVGDIVYILHSDSIAVGDAINLLFSNLSELDHLSGLRKLRSKGINRLRQLSYFTIKNGLLFKEPKEVLRLLFSQDDYRSIQADTQTGKTLIKAFFLATVFGDMNRDMILSNYEKILQEIMPEAKLEKLGSHSHDSLMIELNKSKTKIVQRNGVQCLADSQTFILPGALGTESYLMANPNNEEAYYSSNHGVGRYLDKHIAREEFNNESTVEEIKKRNLKLFRVGKGNIGEQNPNAFKDVFKVTEVMEKENLGNRVAKLRPICSMKG